MAYKAPIWEDGKSPAISAENLNNLSRAAEGAQVLYGNSAPTSSTEGAVGQFYLVVVADSDGNYPLYQCVSIANGSYVWRDTRRIPDSITSMLGIPAPGTINGALNVLAHVGNLHVWERVQNYADPVPEVPAGYTLGEIETNVVLYTGSKSGARFMYSSNVTVSMSGVISIGTTQTKSYSGSTNPSLYNDYLRGKFVTADTENNFPDYSTEKAQAIFYVPSDAELSWNVDGNIIISKYQSVIGYPYTPAIPAGTHVDYLTSTDRNAYTDGTVDNTTITYLGQLGGGARIEVGSYVGTGTYGKSNPNTLTFGVEPQLVAIFSPSQNGNYAYKLFMLRNVLGASILDSDGNNNGVIVTWSEKSVTWYVYGSKNANYQMNVSNYTYHYIAIG